MFNQLITSSDRGNMFACDQCQYKAGTKAMLNIHHNNLHRDMKYICNTCGIQRSSKGGLSSHQQIHEGKKYPCDSCDYQATERGNLTRHKQSKHLGKK